MIKAIIFDMDGTLYDTEAVYKIAWIKAGIPEETYYKLIGRSRVNIRQILFDEGFDVDKVCQKKAEYTQELLKDGIPLKSGVIETLSFLKENGFKTAIATSSAIEVAKKYLAQTNMEQFFDKTRSGNRLEHGKPAPDIFLYAAQELNASPSECMVVEDSYNGVMAGVNAKMHTVMIPDLVPADEFMQKSANAILDSLKELPEYINKINASK